jgi:phage gp16-like protein
MEITKKTMMMVESTTNRNTLYATNKATQATTALVSVRALLDSAIPRDLRDNTAGNCQG